MPSGPQPVRQGGPLRFPDLVRRPVHREVGELVAEEGALPLCILAGRHHRALECLLPGGTTFETGQELPAAVQTRDGQTREIGPFTPELGELRERSRRQHRFETPADARLQPAALGKQRDAAQISRPHPSRRSLPLIGEQRTAGRLQHLEGTEDALAVLRMQTLRHLRIPLPQLVMQCAAGQRQGAKPRADFRRDGRNGGDPLPETPDIEAGAAHQNDRPSLLRRPREHRLEPFQPQAGGTLLVGFEDAVELMLRPLPLKSVRLGGKQRQMAVELLGVGIDDPGTGSPGEIESQGRLAARRGASYDENPYHRPSDRLSSAMSDPILCVVAPAGHDLLDAALIRGLRSWVPGELRWLDPGRAFEIRPSAPLSPSTRAQVERFLSSLPVDFAMVPAACRRKRLLVCDMDSTIVDIECIDELAAHAGIREKVSELTRRAMAGEIDFRDALEARVRMLAGLPVRVIDEICRERLHLNPGARTLVRTMQAHGAFCALVSGGFTEFTRHVRVLAGFDMDQANTLEIRDGYLTGRLLPPLYDPSAKERALRRLLARFGLAREESLAIGDGANDIPMLRAAGLGIAYRAHPAVRSAADAAIDHGDLTTALHFQGFARSEFVEE